ASRPSAAPDAPASRPSAAPDAPASRPSAAPDAPASRPSAAPDGPTTQPAADGPTTQPAAAADGPTAAAVDARAAHAQRTWRQKVGLVGQEFADHRQRYRERAIAEQSRIAQAEDEAHARTQQEIEAERLRTRAEADEAYRRRVEEARESAAQTAEARAREDAVRLQQEYNAAKTRAEQRAAQEQQRTTDRYARAKTDAADTHARETQRLQQERADLDARLQRTMDEAAQIKDAGERARAEASARERHASDRSWLERRQQSVDERRASAEQRAEADYTRSVEQDAASARRGQELAAESHAAAERRAAFQRQQAQARADYEARRDGTTEKHRAYDDAFNRRNERMATDPDRAARDARTGVEGGPNRFTDGLRPDKAWRNNQIDDYDYRPDMGDTSWRDGGRRSLAWGDVSAKELSPGYNPGGAFVRDWVDQKSKDLFLDPRVGEMAGGPNAAEVARREREADQKEVAETTGEAPAAQPASGGASTPKATATPSSGPFLPDHKEQPTEATWTQPGHTRKNPNYQPPPAGSLQALDALRAKLEVAVAQEKQASAAAKAMKDEQQKHEANEGPLGELHGEAQKAAANLGAHKTDIGVKSAANVKQAEKQAVAAAKIDDYAGQSSKFDAVITPMRGVERFTYIGSRLGVSYFDDMNKEIKSTLKGFDEMTAAMKKEAANQPAAKAEIKAKGDEIKATDQKAAATDQAFQKNEADVVQIKTDNTETIQKAAAAHDQAAGEKSKFAGQAAQYRQQYNAMASSLLGWAQAHRAARAGEEPVVEATAGEEGEPEAGGDGAAAGAPPAQEAAPGPAGAPAAAPGPAGAPGPA
ncbi:MAG: hypothetical protein KJZ91_27170, partial [Myxococcales bacterium]|nr:hypothetical protein [Myxococcales bacterium]